jgi:hypothetical protein
MSITTGSLIIKYDKNLCMIRYCYNIMLAKKKEKKITGKYGGKVRGSHVTSGNVTSGQACAMVRSSTNKN